MTTKVSRLIPEKDLLATVVEMAQTYGWLVHHVLESRHYAKRIGPGYPDLTLVSQPPMRARIIFAELKRDDGKVTTPQWEWLDALGRCRYPSGPDSTSPVEVYVWRPQDLPIIECILGV